MIAIPLDTKDSTVISELYGKAPYFALLNLTEGSFKVVPNEGKGNGSDCAKFVSQLGASATIFIHMGEKLFDYLFENNIDVYTTSKTVLTIEEIYTNMLNQKCKLLTKENCKRLLDPGSSTCYCECEKK